MHFFGAYFNIIAIILTSTYILYYLIFNKKIDLYLIFLLLVPSIIFRDSREFVDSDLEYLPIVGGINNVLILGPLALSSKLTFCFGVFIRSFLNKSNYRNHSFLLYLFLVFTAFIALVSSYLSGGSSPSGLTVGFRIVLTFSVFFLPKFTNPIQFKTALTKIFIFSTLLLMLKLLNEHWYFVTFAFIPFLWETNKLYFLFILGFISSIAIGLFFKITILMIILISFISYFLIMKNFFSLRVMKNKFILVLLIILPILITISVLIMDSVVDYNLTNLAGFVKFKLLGDRKPIWDASYDSILNSSFLFGNPGSSFDVYFSFLNQTQLWTAGSHNIFLEMGRHLGLFSMLFLSCILVSKLIKIGFNLHDKGEIAIFFMFFSVYFSVGIGGQAIIYDGVGTLYLFLLNQFYFTLKSVSS
jgi:hypothetical protein